jgi:hypothetical protein
MKDVKIFYTTGNVYLVRNFNKRKIEAILFKEIS